MAATTNAFKIFTDGGARGNPGPAATGFVIFQDTKQLFQAGQYLGEATNNQAEYHAVLSALQWLVDWCTTHSPTPPTIEMYLDANLVVQQLNGKFKIKNQQLAKIAAQIFQLIHAHRLSISFHHIPREKNYLADSLVNQALDREK